MSKYLKSPFNAWIFFILKCSLCALESFSFLPSPSLFLSFNSHYSTLSPKMCLPYVSHGNGIICDCITELYDTCVHKRNRALQESVGKEMKTCGKAWNRCTVLTQYVCSTIFVKTSYLLVCNTFNICWLLLCHVFHLQESCFSRTKLHFRESHIWFLLFQFLHFVFYLKKIFAWVSDTKLILVFPLVSFMAAFSVFIFLICAIRSRSLSLLAYFSNCFLTEMC